MIPFRHNNCIFVQNMKGNEHIIRKNSAGNNLGREKMTSIGKGRGYKGFAFVTAINRRTL